MIVTRSSLKPVDFDGLRIFDYTAGKELASSVAVIEVPPGARHAEAWSRRSDKYYLVTQGEIRFVLDGQPTTLGPGDICVVTRGQRFSYSNERHDSAVLALFHTPSFRLEDEVLV